MDNKLKILVVGSGGREHCLAWKIAQSPLVDKIYCAPGNGGTSLVAENIDIEASDVDSLLEFALKERIGLTVVGPEAPLVLGIVDKFNSKGLKVFGPDKELALLEGSKIFSKKIMEKFRIPTAAFEIFDDCRAAYEYVKSASMPIVIKADGLAAGKGVIIAASVDEAKQAIDLIMVKKKFGASGDRVIIEECLEGEEASMLVITDGKNILPLASSQDHKRVLDGDCGPNTGGMGAYSPAPIVNDIVYKRTIDKVFKPLIAGLNNEGRPYRGVLYAGLMIKDDEPLVLEFNVRFGDPETQAVLPKLNSDLAEVMLAVSEGRLQTTELDWDSRTCLCVVLASGGYPGSYDKGKEIKGLSAVKVLEDIYVFHAGTKQKTKNTNPDKEFITNGGRVLGVVSLAKSIKEAQNKVYSAVEIIHFENMHYRKDIGDKALITRDSD